MMNDIIKRQILGECNNLEVKRIFDFISEGHFTLNEFIEAGLETSKIIEIESHIKAYAKRLEEDNSNRKAAQERQEILDDIIRFKLSAAKIRQHLNNNLISFDDLDTLDLSPRLKKSLLNYLESPTSISSYSISELPEMQVERTDVYCIGLAGTGKTTMITGLLKSAHDKGKLISDTYAGNQGINFQTTIIQNLNRGFIPPRTGIDSYIYVPVSIQDDNGVSHPLNIVDVPGEIFRNINNTGEAREFLKYINNDNKKIFFIVIDPDLHENPTKDSLEQSLVYPNILQILRSEGISDQIDALYLVVNKFDYLMDNDLSINTSKEEGEIAFDFINKNYKTLVTNCLNVRDNSRYKFKIKTMPFSIGKLKWGAVLEEFNPKYSETLLEILINDSFVIKGGPSKIFR